DCAGKIDEPLRLGVLRGDGLRYMISTGRMRGPRRFLDKPARWNPARGQEVLVWFLFFLYTALGEGSAGVWGRLRAGEVGQRRSEVLCWLREKEWGSGRAG